MLVEPGIHQIRFPVDRKTWGTCYFIGGSIPALIDAGTDEIPALYILPYLNRLGVSLQDIRIVVVTHRHRDHAGGIKDLQKRGSFKTLAGEWEIPYLENPWLDVEERKKRHPENHIYQGLAKTEIEGFLPPAIRIDDRLQDGQYITMGDRQWQVLHTPGHCSGIISLYQPSSRVLLTFDSIQGGGTRGGLAIYDDLPEYMRSIEKIEALEIRKLIVAHPLRPFSKSVLEGEEVASLLNASRDFPLRYEKKILALADRQRNPLSLSQITDKLRRWQRCDGPRFLSLMTVRAHLDQLESRGVGLR